MKTIRLLLLAILLLGVFAVALTTRVEAASMNEKNVLDEKAPRWSRVATDIITSLDENVKYNSRPSVRVVHKGGLDWCVSLPKPVDVQPGEMYEGSVFVKSAGPGDIGLGLVLRSGQQVRFWNYGWNGVKGESGSWRQIAVRFIVPRGVTSVQPRLTGTENVTAWFADFQFKKTGSLDLAAKEKNYILENDSIKLVLHAPSGAFDVQDKRTGRIWKQNPDFRMNFVNAVEQNKNSLDFTLFDGLAFQNFKITLRLDGQKPECVAVIDSDDHNRELPGELGWPFPFMSQKGDRVMLPLNEGISFPVEEQAYRLSQLYAYGGHGLCMAFWGHYEDKIGPVGGPGYLAIVETSDDAAVRIDRKVLKEGDTPLLCVWPCWVSQMKKFGYARQIRYAFVTEGGHVALCKRYRKHAADVGLLVPFTEKIKKNPNLKKGLEMLVGAANIWYWNNDRVEVVKEMKAVGMDRLLWSGGGTAEDLAIMNSLGGVLTSRYDIYQDIMDPSRLSEVYRHPDWTQEAWPHDINWTDPDGTWRKGWGVTPKGKSSDDPKVKKIRCAVICDSRAIPYARKRISEELKVKPYKARFLDTTVAAPWYECWHPDHMMTRSDSRVWKMKLLDLMGSEFNLVCGSETGHEASVPYCDFYEGMMSLGPYRLPHGGLNDADYTMATLDYIKKYQTGAAYRLPLWELVYHDCTVAQYYWYDFSNRREDLWVNRDLFCALYGVPPMYRFTRKFWHDNKKLFAASYKIAATTSRLTGFHEMTDHQILTKDRLVQKTVFANGVSVIANFGLTPWTSPNGQTVPPRSRLLIQ
ncbi:MAG: glycoside hydrolase [Thermoguttaceae bacterium]|nr:glycoside hydrolase [Thermoguttaceae bacterium]